mmetsp:Transcript_47156/g.52713  ORF Transcript_47156/g.52713 Transcript_47156/m.52713 type:complete len:703 (-) Transcript_47156:137-2245(-)
MMNISKALLILGLLLSASVEVAIWGEGLPWDDLSSQISPSAALVDTSPANYLEECTPEIDRAYSDRSMHGNIDQPHGLCMAQFFCAFDKCYPNPEASTVTPTERIFVFDATIYANYSTLDPQIRAWTDDVTNPTYNLPSNVLFLVVDSDVVLAVQYAKKHGLELSVKNSGHNYNGASTKKDTIHINMNRYTHYAPTSVIDCDPSTVDDTLASQPCRLSLAKNETAVVRIGGGENWDKTYRAVHAVNEAQPDGYKYHIVGGAAATVSPMGWAFQGGLSGTSAGRTFGFGVDQILQVEMVLPNGQHVKFGPTSWEDIPNAVPKTTSVSGVCRTNSLERDEEKWEWTDCPIDINFDDLWFALRGGGGGTWGVVLSLYYQLYEYLPFEKVAVFPLFPLLDSVSALEPTQQALCTSTYLKFELLFLLDPESVGVTPEVSNACGCPIPGDQLYCFGEGTAKTFDEAWRRYVNESIRESWLESGMPASFIDELVNCDDCATILYYKDYASSRQYEEGHRFYGLATDDGVDIPSKTATAVNIIIPKEWILKNIDKAVELMPPSPLGYRAYGGRNAGATSDQANSLSQAHREGGYHIFAGLVDTGIPGFFTYDDSFFTDLFPEMYDTSDGFPSYLGGNHAGPNTMGPLKDDWTKACPLDWTDKERTEKCISQQEIIYGTKLLARLEAIKVVIDPDYMFDCYKCIGNNRDKS